MWIYTVSLVFDNLILKWFNTDVNLNCRRKRQAKNKAPIETDRDEAGPQMLNTAMWWF